MGQLPVASAPMDLVLRCQQPTEPALPPVCPSCGSMLESRKCKQFCARCGYFESCADLI